MQMLARQVLRLSLIGYVVVHYIWLFFPDGPYFANLLALFGFVLIVSLFLTQSVSQLLLPMGLIGLSLLIWAVSRSSLLVLRDGLNEMADLLPIVLIAPLLSWVFQHRPYIQALLARMKFFLKSPLHLFLLITFFSFFSSFFMILAGMVMVFALFHGNRKWEPAEDWDRFVSTASLRGFTIASFSSFFIPSFIYSVQGLGAELWRTLFLGMGLSAAAFILNGCIFFLEHRRSRLELPVMDMSGETSPRKQLWEFFILIAFTVCTTIAVIQFSDINILLFLPPFIVLLNLLYFTWHRDLSVLRNRGRDFIDRLPSMGKEVLLVMAIGLLAAAVRESGWGEWAFKLLMQEAEVIHLSVYIVFSLVIVLLGFLGLPPIPGIVLVTGILPAVPAGISPELLALSLIAGVAATHTLAPVTVAQLVLSNLNGHPTWQTGFRWNWLYGVLVICVAQIYISFLNMALYRL